MKLTCNCCDGIYRSFDVFFTSNCDNRCRHCIDRLCRERRAEKGLDALSGPPDPVRIAETIAKNADGFEDALFLGGEPLLYMRELLECVRRVKAETGLKCYVTTSMPKAAADDRALFLKLLGLVDGMTVSVQHHDERIADEIRGAASRYDRHGFYRSIPDKSRIRIAANLVKGYFSRKEDVIDLVRTYEDMGFSNFKLTELQHAGEFFVSFESLFGVRMGPPYSTGCQTRVDLTGYGIRPDTTVLLKRSCFFVEESRPAFFRDALKLLCRRLFRAGADGRFMMVDNAGRVHRGWTD